MANESIPAAFGINQFLWSKIQEEGILDPANYAGLAPIIPIQEEPELLKVIEAQPGIESAPYIVYTWYNNGIDQDWFMPYDQLIYVVNSLDQNKLRKLILLIMKYFKRYDESARLVNSYIHQLAEGGTAGSGPWVYSQEYRNYEYKEIRVQAATGGAPTTLENEPIKATVTLRLCYTNSGNDVPLS